MSFSAATYENAKALGHLVKMYLLLQLMQQCSYLPCPSDYHTEFKVVGLLAEFRVSVFHSLYCIMKQ
jgi:hypothetical protein